MTAHSTDSRAYDDYGNGDYPDATDHHRRQSQHPFYPYSQPQHPHHSQQSFPPVPPARSSSLHVPPHFALQQLSSSSSSLIDAPPSVLVTQATPTKSLKTRRESAISTTSTEPSPTRSAVPSVFDVSASASSMDADGDDEMKGKSRRRDEVEDSSDEEREQTKLETEEEQKKARAREKGRERQRRKRERDKKAKEVSYLAVQVAKRAAQ